MSKITMVNTSNFKEEVREYKGLTLVHFWADWCGPCRLQDPILEEIAKEGVAKVCRLNVDDNESITNNFGIRSIPTLMFFVNGELMDKTVGLKRKDDLKERIKTLLDEVKEWENEI